MVVRTNQRKIHVPQGHLDVCIYLQLSVFSVINVLTLLCYYKYFYPYCNELWIAYSYNVWLNLLLAFLHFNRERTILRLIWICIDSVTYPVKGLKHFKTDWSLVFWMLAWRYRYAIFNQDIFYKRVDFCVLKSI